MKHNWGKELFPKIVWFQEGPGVRNTQYRDTGVKLLNVANLVDSHVDLSTSNRYISEEEAYGKYKHFLVDDGDFIIASSGIQASYFHKKMGFINKTHLPLCMNTSTIRFKVLDDSKLNIYFFQYYLKSFDFNLQLQKALTGCAQLNFGPSHLKKMKCPLPPMVVQEHIVAELDKINEVIDDCRELLRTLDALAQSLFYDYFGDPIANPKGWQQKSLKDISLVKIGPFGSLLHKEDYIGGGTPLINPIHMKNGYVKVDYDFTIDDAKKCLLSNYLLKTNDIVFGRRGDIGRCALITSKEDGYLCGTGSLFVRFSIDINPIFALWCFMQPGITKYLIEKAKGATMLNINCGIVESVPLIIPPLSLQEDFAAKIEAIEAQKAKVESAIAQLQRLLDSRMDYWFN